MKKTLAVILPIGLICLLGLIGLVRLLGNNSTKTLASGSLSATFSNTNNATLVTLNSANYGISFSQPLDNPSLSQTSNTVTYKDSTKQTEIIYKKIKNGLKEEIILYQKPNTNKFNIKMSLTNLTIGKNFDGLPVFYDLQGNYQYHFDTPFAKDNKGDITKALSYKIHQINNSNEYEIYLVIDQEWLNNPKTAYPVIIDPTIIKDEVTGKPEIIGRRTAGTRTFLVDGKYATRSGYAEETYKDQNGKYQDTDTFFNQVNENNYQYEVTKNSFLSFFKNTPNDYFAQYQTGNSSFRFKLLPIENFILNTSPETTIKENTLTYQNYYPNIDLRYTITGSRFLEEFIINNKETASAISKIDEELLIENADYEPQTDGSINFYQKGTKEILWIVPKPVMYELNDTSQTNYGLHYDLKCQNSNETMKQCNSVILSKVLDPEGKDWLASADRVYPIVIDLSAGPKNPGTMADDSAVGTLTWTNPDNAKTSNNAYTTAGTASVSTTHYLKATNFGFTIPVGATINGIVAEIERYAAGTSWKFRDSAVKIVKADGTIGSTNKGDLTTIWPTSDPNTYVTYGASDNTWDLSWTPDNINDSDFGVVLSTVTASSSFSEDTPVSTPDGPVKISDIEVGDQVYSFNLSTNSLEIDEVTYVSQSIIDTKFIIIHLETGDIIKATPNHPFYVKGEWIKAEDLSVGNLLLDTDGKDVLISGITVEESSLNEVWNLTIKNNHNFFAGNVLVHNPPVTSASVDHISMTVYYTEAPPGIRFQGVKMQGICVGDAACPITATFYSSASDGMVDTYRKATYAIAHDAAAGDYVDTSYNYVSLGQVTSRGYTIWRGFVFFDTSSIPANATITAATLSLYGFADNSTTDFNIQIQNGQPTYPHDPLVAGDYLYSQYSGNGGTFNTAGFSISGYNDITLNSTGLTWITKAGSTKLAILSDDDINNTSTNTSVLVYTNEQGSGYQPKLVITYTLP